MDNIVLIGFMGSGKSTVGKILADRLELDFVDTDRMIEERTGRSIQQIFSDEGEDRFRDLEKRVVASICAVANTVVSAGGGVILRRENRSLLKKETVVYLRLTEEELLDRTARLSGRPLLRGRDRKARVRDLLSQRSHLYEQTADVIIDVEKMSASQVADEIAERLGKN